MLLRCCAFKTQIFLEIPLGIYITVRKASQPSVSTNIPTEMNLFIFSLVTLAHNGQGRPGILQDIGSWIHGIKYVPPAEDKVSLFQPVDKVTPTTQRISTTTQSDERNVVFNRTDGWVQPAGSGFLYKVGEQEASFYESKYWCQEEGGRLAEIRSGDEMELVKTVLERQVKTNYWLGLEKESRTWMTTGDRREYQHWVEGEPNQRYNERCVVLQARKQFRWSGWNCGFRRDGETQFKALCQKEDNVTSDVVPAQSKSPHIVSLSQESVVTRRCSVAGLSLTGQDWVSRLSNVSSAEQCHQDCINTRHCHYWTWRSDSRLCYLKKNDGPVVKDLLSVSGTTSDKQGCRRSLFSPSSQLTKVEHCSCVNVALDLVSGYLDPRTLSSDTDHSKLGRLIRHNACPPGQKLQCTDSTTAAPQTRVPSITECLVNDVRMKVGGHVGVHSHVADAATCYTLCLAQSTCHYWTWRGETLDRKCFLLPRETRVVRRQGSVSGTAQPGCEYISQHGPEYREDADDDETFCDCQPDPDQDLVASGLIDPRALPSGRIVNNPRPSHCPPGYKKTCRQVVKKPLYDTDPANWVDQIDLTQKDVPRRQTDDSYLARNVEIHEDDGSEAVKDDSAVGFPEN